MASRQRFENGRYHTTNHVGGGSDHEGQRLLGWVVTLAILALVFLALNGGIELVIDVLVKAILGL